MKLLIMRKGLGIFLVFSLVIISCSDDEQVAPDLGLDYYPLHVGNYSVFQVEETTITLSVEIKTSYELKVAITDSSINEQGVTTYSVIRQKRMNTSSNWENLDTWSCKVLNNRLVQNEGNVLFVKLIFPPSLNLMWDGNEFNNLQGDGNLFTDNSSGKYVVSELNKPITLQSGFESDQTLTVVQNDFTDDIIGIDQRKEVYAKTTGLIYREVNQLQYCTSSNCLGQRRVDKGFILTQSLKEHGKI